MVTSIKDQITVHGYALIPNLCIGSDTVAIAAALGRPLTPWKDGLVQELVPRTSAPPNTYSGIYGLNRFPFHTDLAHWRLPPRYLLLRCINGYTDVPTLLFDGQTLIEGELRDILTRAIFKSRRPLDGAIKLLRLCEATDNGYRLRWDEVFLRPASRVGELAYQRIKEHLVNSSPISIPLARLGDTLLIDNWRMLHARAPIHADRLDRKIERIYLEGLN
jgi:L-asparagine oxygenase